MMVESIGDIMIDRKNLLTIGNFAKQTGVSIKSLRYYDEIGILPPIYTDPFTKYRYYSFEQIAIVNIIKLCINLGIPLKEIKDFIKKEDFKISYEQLIDYGIESTQNSIYELSKKISFLEKVKKDLNRVNSYSFEESKIFEMPEKYCYVLHYKGNIGAKNYRPALKTLIAKAIDKGYNVGYESGTLFHYKNDCKEQFIFIDIDYNGSNLPENVLYIPACKYICRKVKYSLINDASNVFKEQFSKNYDKFIFENWKYTGEFNTSDTFLEIRCSLP